MSDAMSVFAKCSWNKRVMSQARAVEYNSQLAKFKERTGDRLVSGVSDALALRGLASESVRCVPAPPSVS
eukprot:4904457-Pyramimonas_sp.AAC.1